MKKEPSLLKTLKIQGFSNIDIDQIFNYLETLDYDLKNTKYIGKNELASKEKSTLKVD